MDRCTGLLQGKQSLDSIVKEAGGPWVSPLANPPVQPCQAKQCSASMLPSLMVDILKVDNSPTNWRIQPVQNKHQYDIDLDFT